MSGLDPDRKCKTLPITLSCLYQLVDHVFKLFHATGLWISL